MSQDMETRRVWEGACGLCGAQLREDSFIGLALHHTDCDRTRVALQDIEEFYEARCALCGGWCRGADEGEARQAAEECAGLDAPGMKADMAYQRMKEEGY